MGLILLAIMGLFDGMIYVFRIRSAVKDNPWVSDLTCLVLCVGWMAKVYLGVSAWASDTSFVLAAVAYAVPAAISNHFAHRISSK